MSYNAINTAARLHCMKLITAHDHSSPQQQHGSMANTQAGFAVWLCEELQMFEPQLKFDNDPLQVKVLQACWHLMPIKVELSRCTTT
jgi:hypothetical protein